MIRYIAAVIMVSIMALSILPALDYQLELIEARRAQISLVE